MKLPQKAASAAADFISRNIKAASLFTAVLCCFPAFLFQPSAAIACGEALLFAALALLCRGKIRLLPALGIWTGIIFFSLLVPYGRIVFKLGNFTITEGALVTGIRKSAVLTGMVFLSQTAVSSRLSFPGRLGTIIASMFFYFNRFSQAGFSLKKGKLLESIDETLCAVYSDSSLPETNRSHAERNSVPGLLILMLLPLLLYALLAYGFITAK